MRRFIYLVVILLTIVFFFSCQNKDIIYSSKYHDDFLGLDTLKKPISGTGFNIRIVCVPSFHESFAVTLKDTGEQMRVDFVRQNMIKIDINPETGEPNRFNFTLIHDDALVVKAVAEKMRQTLKDIKIHAMTDSSEFGLDGMGVNCKYRGQQEQSDFSFWSPDPQSNEYKLMRAVFDCCYNSALSEKTITFLKTAEEYFN